MGCVACNVADIHVFSFASFFSLLRPCLKLLFPPTQRGDNPWDACKLRDMCFFFFLRFVFFLPACLRLLFTLFRTTSTVTMAAAVERGRPSVWPSQTPPPASSPRGPTETLAVSFCQFREGCDGCWWVVVVVALGPLFLDTVLVLIWHCHLSKC